MVTLSRYAEVAAALRADSPGDRYVRDEGREFLTAAKMADWRERLAPVAEELAAARPIELVGGLAEPLSFALAEWVCGPADRSLAEDLFAAAAEPFDGELEERGKAAASLLGSQLHSPFLVQAFVALTQTLPGFLAGAWLALLEHPDQMELLRDEPDLVTNAIEELLRYAGPARAQLRGDTVLMLAEANRDPEQFPDPDRLDLRREGIAHLAFGGGPHACVGASLIRMAAGVATAAFVRYYAGAKLAGPVEWRGGFAIRAPGKIHVQLIISDLGD